MLWAILGGVLPCRCLSFLFYKREGLLLSSQTPSGFDTDSLSQGQGRGEVLGGAHTLGCVSSVW